MTDRSTAIYFAKQAYSLLTMRGIRGTLKNFRAGPFNGYLFEHANGYKVVIGRAADCVLDGAVNASLTKRANETSTGFTTQVFKSEIGNGFYQAVTFC